MKSKRSIEGLIVPAVTPKYHSTVDEESLQHLMRHIMTNGADGVFVLGTTGEFQYLTVDEKEKVMMSASAANNQKMSLMVGVSANTIEETAELAMIADQYQADAAVIAPLYGEGSPRQKVMAVLQNCSTPLMLYNNPAIHGGSNLSINSVKDFASDQQVIGIKDSSGDQQYFAELLQLSSKRFSVFQGADDYSSQPSHDGAAGLVESMGNITPGVFRELCRQRTEAHLREVLDLYEDVRRLSPNYIHGIKIKLVELGILKSAELWNGSSQ